MGKFGGTVRARNHPQRLSAVGYGEFELREVTGFIGNIPRCCGGAMASTSRQLGLGGKQFGSPPWTRFELLRANWHYDRTYQRRAFSDG